MWIGTINEFNKIEQSEKYHLVNMAKCHLKQLFLNMSL